MNTVAGRRLPPYSRKLNAQLHRGTILLFTGRHGWHRAGDMHGRSLVLPDDCSPEDFDWSPVRDCGVIVMDYKPLTTDDAGNLTIELMDAGAECIIWSDQVNQHTGWLHRGSTRAEVAA